MEGTIGEVRYFAGNFAPKNWAFCQGQMIPITKNTSLYSILGARFGGDGMAVFALPKIEDLNGCKAIICENGTMPDR
jgi:microcystin-dependent protein